MYEDGAAYYELATGQATSAPISCLAFDQHEEAAWFGCSNGWISQSTDGTFSCMELYRNGTQILIGCGQKGLVAYDLISGKSTGQWETEGMGAVALRGPLSGGGYLAASPAGKIFVMDGRSRSVRPGTSLTAHVGGFAAVDAAGSLVATAGYSIRGGHPVLERAVKVFDIRMAPRLLCTLPFGAGPVFLRFHPHLPSTLLAGSASGAVSLLDAAGYGAGTHLSLPGLEQGAGGITCADFSPSGQCIGLGSASGWVHMLGVGSMPSVAGRGAEVPAPPAGNPAPLVSLGEGDPLSRAPLFYNLEGPRPLSSLHPGERASVGLAPRVVDPSLQPLIKWAKERLAWWKGLQDLPGGPLPSVLAFSCDGQPEGVLLVRQGADLDAMAAPDSMLYELTGVVAHVCDADESLEWGTDLYEGHLVAHIKVNWWLFNDFSIQPVPAAEAGELYDGQKVPCLLFYTRRAVDAEERAARMHEEEGLLGTRPTPVLSSLGFQALCRISPLGLRANLRAPTFLPLGPDELPRPGMLLALDAEFVSYSPPQYSLVRGMEVTTRPSRLGLARVSVVRGEGALEGTACIDDYIRSPEAVHDYLTRFSGIVPGDLDPARSPHCLTTLRRAYLKLRYLVDSGVRFVGHGLKQDFRMINILVPSEQIVDTVRLFHKPRMRQLSLRFLASYLLKTSIQSGNHDSIEDAHTALRLYKEYLRLEASGALAWTLDELYNWGKAFGRVVVAMSVLEDVVALVCCADAVRNARQAIQARLREHGARVVQRLSKDVSHVVFERKHVPPSAKRAEPDADLLELYTKLDKSWFQDYDYSACNASPFVGLENDLANSYCNALVQALFFVPGVRAALLRHVPRSNDEFCLAGELALLFRMLQTRGAVVCRASNLLRALRQSPQALALGLGLLGTRPTPVLSSLGFQALCRISPLPTPSQRAPSPGPRPSPWSAERPWDAPREGARSRRTVAKRARKTTGRVVRQEPAAGAQPCARRARGAKLAAEVPVAEELAGPRDPQPVLLALTSVDKDVAELARSATLRLRGIRLCSSGRGEAGATHLVLGRERRTIKLLLALANGAWLVTPQWITASLDAGEWLPARQFPVGERFRAAAERSRSAREHGATLLAGQRLYIHARTGSGTARPRKSDASVERREGGAASAADLGSLRRLAGALGAELTGPTECSLCILAGDAPRPATLPPAVPSVTSGWLLHAAEHYQVPPVEATWLVA
ncbi:hypothetical protein APUTEX25_003095 [Auxenochlorella protothecoides]|uniref:BRCT domain-containing protein n=1 Tax=Auxenochlorella protothecoides TaxID=3075 RepID=A0A3M7KWI5_AUXPR|nr:hypothetical protein APUTEX25_003095 [Auxenochlorella protothecoides]|eukprot:RMZ54717.1 hypothetical protein APUTEX25_003095 [Auxenochlorella protothecoides]